MRSFLCLIRDARSAAPTQSFILANSIARARAIARRELLGSEDASEVQIFEAGRPVVTVKKRGRRPQHERSRRPRSAHALGATSVEAPLRRPRAASKPRRPRRLRRTFAHRFAHLLSWLSAAPGRGGSADPLKDAAVVTKSRAPDGC